MLPSSCFVLVVTQYPSIIMAHSVHLSVRICQYTIETFGRQLQAVLSGRMAIRSTIMVLNSLFRLYLYGSIFRTVSRYLIVDKSGNNMSDIFTKHVF